MEFSEIYYRIPFLTRCWLTTTVGLSLLATVQFIDANKLPLYWDPVVNNREIWRPLTAVFYCPPQHYFFIINNYFLYRYSEKLERREFAGRPHDYLMMLLFNWLFCVAISYWCGFTLLISTMVMSVLTVWCQFNPHAVISTKYWNGMSFRAPFLPWAILVANIVYYHRYGHYCWFNYESHGATLASNGTEEFAGIIAGYLTHHLIVEYPSLLRAPVFMKQWFGTEHFFNTPSGNEDRESQPRQPRSTRNTRTETHGEAYQRGRGYTYGNRASQAGTTEARMNESFSPSQIGNLLGSNSPQNLLSKFVGSNLDLNLDSVTKIADLLKK